MTALTTELDTEREKDREGRHTTPPSRSRFAARRVALLGAVAVVAVGAAVAVATWPSEPETFTVRGTVTLGNDPQGDPKSVGKPCMAAPSGGFSDIRKGTQVVITDRAGGTVAIGVLSGGIEQGGPKVGYRCAFEFAVDGVPAGKEFYGVSLGARDRAQYRESTVRKDKIGVILGG
jgi:hypothetical protein